MSNFQINNLNATTHTSPGKARKRKSQGAKIDTTDSFKPSLKSATSPIDLKEAAKIFSKKAEEIPNIKWEFNSDIDFIFTTEPAFMEDGSILIKSYDKKMYSINPEDGSKNWDLMLGNYSSNPPTIGPDNMLFTDCKGSKSVCAIDGKTGKMLWDQDVKVPIYSHSPMMGPDGNVYVTNDYYGDLYGFDPKTGEKKVQFKVGHHHALLRGITDEGIAVVVKDGSLAIGYDIRTEEKKWEHQINPEEYRMKSTYTQDDCLYSSNVAGKIFGVDGKAGKLKWKFDTASYTKQNAKTYQISGLGQTITKVRRELLDKKPGVEDAPVLGKDGKVYVYDSRGILFAMDPDTGKPSWIYDSPVEITTTPLITEKGEVFVGNEDREVVKLDATGKEIWKSKLPNDPRGKPVVTEDNILFVNTEHGHTARLSADTGRVLRSYDTPGRDLKMAVLPGKGEHAIVGDGKGKMICIGREKYYEKPPEDDSSQETNKNLKIEKGKEFVDIGGVKLKIKKEEN